MSAAAFDRCAGEAKHSCCFASTAHLACGKMVDPLQIIDFSKNMGSAVSVCRIYEAGLMFDEEKMKM